MNSRQESPSARCKACWGLGAVTGICLLLVAISGIYMSMFFQPDPVEAYKSTKFIDQAAPLGQFARSLHRWGALFVITLMMAHFVSCCLRGRYRTPNRWTWLLGLAMTLLICTTVITGFLLPWDFRSYWILQTITNWFDKLPAFSCLFDWLFYKDTPNGVEPTGRWFSLHAIVLPLMTGFCLLAHVRLFQRNCEVEDKPACKPSKLARTVLFPTVILGHILTALFGNIQLDAADPVTTTSWPQPSWLLLLFFQVTRYFQDSQEMLGVFWIPVAVFCVTLLLVFVNAGRWNKLVQYGLAALFLTLFVGLNYVTHHTHSTTPLDSCEACHKEGFGEAFAVPPPVIKDFSRHYDNKWLALHYRYPQYFWMMDATVPAW